MRTRLPVLVALLGVVLAACSGAGAGPSAAPTLAPSSDGIELTVFGAASLRTALEAAKPVYEAAAPGVTLTISTDSSAALATQIEQGAPADVFLSADTTNPQRLVDGGFAAADAVVFAGNELTVIAPADNPAGLANAFDLAKDGLRVIAAGDEVPITRYATRLVDNLANEAAAPADFAAAYAANIASKEDDVAAVRSKIELGEGDAAIVYVTDATVSGDKVLTIAIPATSQVAAAYAGVVVKASPNVDAAMTFLAWIAGPAGQAVLADFGFRPPVP